MKCKWKTLVLAGAAAFLGLATVAVLLPRILFGGTSTAFWTQDPSIQDRFLIACFPAESFPADLPQRLMLMSWGEYSSNQAMFTVYDDASEAHEVSMDSIRFIVHDPAQAAAFTTRLNQSLSQWGADTDWRSVSFDAEEEGGRWFCTLRVRDRRGRDAEYRYQIYEGRVTPNITRRWP